jgi:hypothetical protein
LRELAQNKDKPLVSATVEGGLGEEAKGKIGPVEVKAGAALKGEVEVSSNGVKVSVVAEADVHIGSFKPLGGVEVRLVTKDEEGRSQDLSSVRPEWTPPGVSGKHNSEATASKDEFTVAINRGQTGRSPYRKPK